MSTRCVINFCGADGELAAKIYRHSDGYPDAVKPDLARFFNEVSAQVTQSHSLFEDPHTLAARFLVWSVEEGREVIRRLNQAMSRSLPGLRAPGERLLDFGNVAILMEDPWDIEYIYSVHCTSKEKPEVVCSLASKRKGA